MLLRWLLTWFIFVHYLVLFIVDVCESLLLVVIELFFKIFVLFTTITTTTALFPPALHIFHLILLHIVILLYRIPIFISFKVLSDMLLRLLIITVWMLVALFKHHTHLRSVHINSLARVFSNHIQTSRLILIVTPTLSVVTNTFFLRLILLVHYLSECATRWTNVSVAVTALTSLHQVLLWVNKVLRCCIILVFIVFFVFLNQVSVMDDAVVVILISDY